MKYCTACQKLFSPDCEVCPGDATLLQAIHEFHPGMIIRNKYQILERIGAGGMGLVYRARHLTFNELCAIKMVTDEIAANENFLRRFQTEAVVTRKLRHPNAVRVEDFDYLEDGRPFLVMELVEGKDVSQVLKQEGPLAAERAVRIASQVAQALAVAHQLGIVHRDIKPGNILLALDQRGQENAKVLDFGIAKLREAAGQLQSEMTVTGMQIGTPLYMAPEQYLGKQAGGEVDGRADIYALGVVLYQMITGQRPFEGDTPYSLMVQHLQTTARPPHEIAPHLGIPEPLSRIVLKAMEKSRELRYQTAEEFVAALDGLDEAPARSIEGRHSEPVTRLGEARPSAEEPEDSAQARPTLMIISLSALASLLVVLVVILGYIQFESSRRTQLQTAVTQKLRSAPSEGLRKASVVATILGSGDVALDGTVSSTEDWNLAASLAASVSGVHHVTNRLILWKDHLPQGDAGKEANDLEAKGLAFLEEGDYAAAIDCFSRASADPNQSQNAKALLDRAQRAQRTEAKLLKDRR